MKDVKEFVRAALDLAGEQMADGDEYAPCAYFLLPDESVDIVLIDPNFMAPGAGKDVLRAMLLAHLRERRAIYGVLVSEAWGAKSEHPAGTTPEQARAALPRDLSTYAGRTELLIASIFGEGMEPIMAKWPYTRSHGKPVFNPEDLQYESASMGVRVLGRFAIDLSRGRTA